MNLQKEIARNNDVHWKDWRNVPDWYWVLCVSGETGELEDELLKTISLWYWVTCISGKSGKLANILKKIYRAEWGWKGKTAKFDDLIEELADIQIYLCLLAEKLNIDLETETRKKIKTVNERFHWGEQ